MIADMFRFIREDLRHMPEGWPLAEEYEPDAFSPNTAAVVFAHLGLPVPLVWSKAMAEPLIDRLTDALASDAFEHQTDVFEDIQFKEPAREAEREAARLTLQELKAEKDAKAKGGKNAAEINYENPTDFQWDVLAKWRFLRMKWGREPKASEIADHFQKIEYRTPEEPAVRGTTVAKIMRKFRKLEKMAAEKTDEKRVRSPANGAPPALAKRKTRPHRNLNLKGVRDEGNDRGGGSG